MSYKVVAVKFVSHDEYGRPNNKTYDYLTSDESLQVEDLVVVRTSNFCRVLSCTDRRV